MQSVHLLTYVLTSLIWDRLPRCRTISYNDLSGSIPSSLGSLTGMISMYVEALVDNTRRTRARIHTCIQINSGLHVRRRLFNNNRLSGSIPPSVSSLVAVKSLCVLIYVYIHVPNCKLFVA